MVVPLGSRDVPCPFCKRGINQVCVMTSGLSRGKGRGEHPHKKRVQLANKVADLLALPEAKTVYVKAQHVLCPHCGEENDGWLGDPRGKETECDYCEKKYMVAAEAELVIR